ncbi:Calmodulin-binding transcription activator 1 [Varanus komodoensis]|nr:Calmodulin-binding transcription activator 1 [Varanus komodoensis]
MPAQGAERASRLSVHTDFVKMMMLMMNFREILPRQNLGSFSSSGSNDQEARCCDCAKGGPSRCIQWQFLSTVRSVLQGGLGQAQRSQQKKREPVTSGSEVPALAGHRSTAECLPSSLQLQEACSATLRQGCPHSPWACVSAAVPSCTAAFNPPHPALQKAQRKSSSPPAALHSHSLLLLLCQANSEFLKNQLLCISDVLQGLRLKSAVTGFAVSLPGVQVTSCLLFLCLGEQLDQQVLLTDDLDEVGYVHTRTPSPLLLLVPVSFNAALCIFPVHCQSNTLAVISGIKRQIRALPLN